MPPAFKKRRLYRASASERNRESRSSYLSRCGCMVARCALRLSHIGRLLQDARSPDGRDGDHVRIRTSSRYAGEKILTLGDTSMSIRIHFAGLTKIIQQCFGVEAGKLDAASRQKMRSPWAPLRTFDFDGIGMSRHTIANRAAMPSNPGIQRPLPSVSKRLDADQGSSTGANRSVLPDGQPVVIGVGSC
jgi:hypothetical protein